MLLPKVAFLKEPRLLVTQPLSAGMVQVAPVKPLEHTQRHAFALMTLVPPFVQGVLFWQEARVGAELECRRGRTIRVTGMITAAAMRKTTMMQSKRKIHRRIPHNCSSPELVRWPEVGESGGNSLWPNPTLELLRYRDRSSPTGVDSPGGGKEANMSESPPEPRPAVAMRVRGPDLT